MIDDFWQRVHSTDQTHFDPTAQDDGYILREAGARYAPKNMQELADKKLLTVHFAACCNC